MTPNIPTERAEQVAVIEWARAHQDKEPCLEWFHCSLNGIRSNARTINKMKAEGLVLGIFDLHLDAARHKYHGLKIDMKRTKGSKRSQGQIEYADFLATEHYLAQFCYGALEAVKLLKWYLGIECNCMACQIVELWQ